MTPLPPGGADTRTVFRLLTADHRWSAVTLAVSSLVSGVLESAIFVLVAQAAAAMVDGESSISAEIGPLDVSSSVGIVLAVACVLGVVRLGLQVVVAYLPARIGADVQTSLRRRLFDGFTDASWGLQAQERDGALQELLTSQVLQATQGVVAAAQVASSGLAFLALLASALVVSVPVALVAVGAAGLLSFALRPLNRIGRGRGRKLSAASLAYADGVSQAVWLAEEAQVFGTAKAQRRKVDDLVTATDVAYFRVLFVGRFTQQVYQGLAILLIVAGLAGLYLSGTGRIAVLSAVVLMLVRSATYAQQAHTAFHTVQQMLPFLDRVLAAEQRYRDAAPAAGAQPLGRVGSVACDRVGFTYPRGAAALVDVSFEVDAGESVGIVGPSGAGKSTLVQVLLRLREPTAGAFVVNGRAATDYARNDWRRRVAYVPQDPKLLHGTVAENIRFFRDIDDGAVERAARLAHIHVDVLSWPSGYDTLIGQRADAVSGGQRQRLCLARALAGAPDVLVLDEPTSALDLPSESLVQESLRALRGQLTLFVVSHRISTLSICDRVLVMTGGRIDAFGSAAQVAGASAFYKDAVLLAGRKEG